jgi:hypothetical protein
MLSHSPGRILPPMNPSRRLVPHVLLGILTLGTGLAIGLGLSEGPVTHSASAAAPPVVIVREVPAASR